jgi:hypothetical protein
MHPGSAAVMPRTSGALLLSAVEANVAELRRRTPAWDEQEKSGSSPHSLLLFEEAEVCLAATSSRIRRPEGSKPTLCAGSESTRRCCRPLAGLWGGADKRHSQNPTSAGRRTTRPRRMRVGRPAVPTRSAGVRRPDPRRLRPLAAAPGARRSHPRQLPPLGQRARRPPGRRRRAPHVPRPRRRARPPRPPGRLAQAPRRPHPRALDGQPRTGRGDVAAGLARAARTARAARRSRPVPPRALTPEQLREVQLETDRLRSTRDRAIMELLLRTGLRIGELADLDVGDVRLTQRTGELVIRHGKSDRRRVVPLNRGAEPRCDRGSPTARTIQPGRSAIAGRCGSPGPASSCRCARSPSWSRR